MKIAGMQPYFLPYLPYFQLISSVDRFIVYDDVQYIQRGWINRNRFLKDGKDAYFTLCLQKSASNTKICDKLLVPDYEKDFSRIVKLFEQSYKRAPYYKQNFEVIRQIFIFQGNNLSKFITNSLKIMCAYLDINTEILISSELGIGTDLKGTERVIKICKELSGDICINSIGGVNLYSKETFREQGIELMFLKSNEIRYRQYQEDIFIPDLSVVDLLMFNDKDQVKQYLNEYTLI